jgi:hypothetical protein
MLGTRVMDEEIAYSDGLVEVSENAIRFRHYYFPIGAKFVRFSDILRLEKRPPTLLNGKWRLWGTGDFRTWFPKDWRRPWRSCIFFLHLATQKTRIGFTVENAVKFMEIIKSKGLTIENP